jgi:hypothetical protein
VDWGKWKVTSMGEGFSVGSTAGAADVTSCGGNPRHVRPAVATPDERPSPTCLFSISTKWVQEYKHNFIILSTGNSLPVPQ